MLNLEYRQLNDREVADCLRELPNWSLAGDKITRSFEFNSYAAGVMFASAVGQIADHLDHHPDIHIGYQTVDLSVNTHSVNGLSPYDFELAKRVDSLV